MFVVTPPFDGASMASREMTLSRKCAAYFWVLCNDPLDSLWGVVLVHLNPNYVHLYVRNFPYKFDPQTLPKTS